MSEGGSKAKSKASKNVRRRNLPLASISAVLSQVVGKYGLEARMKEHAFMSVWCDVVDEPFKTCTRPLFLDHEGNLVVSVKDASVAQELSFRRNELVQRLFPFARAIGLKIKGIRFDLKHFREVESELLTAHSEPAEGRTFHDGPADTLWRLQPDDEELALVELDGESLDQLDELTTGLSTTGGGSISSWTSDGSLPLLSLPERIARLYERELRLKRWREAKGFPACSNCGYREPRLLGKHNLCRNCYIVSLLSSVNKVQD